MTCAKSATAKGGTSIWSDRVRRIASSTLGGGHRAIQIVRDDRAHESFRSKRKGSFATSASGWSPKIMVTKLKLIKRQMYLRAKIDLLQARLVGATQDEISARVRQPQNCTPKHILHAVNAFDASAMTPI